MRRTKATTACLQQTQSQMESYFPREDASLLCQGMAGVGIAKSSAEVCQVK